MDFVIYFFQVHELFQFLNVFSCFGINLEHGAFLDSYHQQEQSQHAISKMSSRRIISFNLRKFSTQSTFRFTYKCQLSFIVSFVIFIFDQIDYF